MKHKKGVKFIFTTVIGGLLFLVPVVFLEIVLTKAAVFRRTHSRRFKEENIYG
jgi:hypothetical protein